MSSITEPAHLVALNALSNDKSLSRKERKLHEREYWRQYSAWQCLVTRMAAAITEIGESDFWTSMGSALSKHWSSKALPQVERIVCLCLGHLDDHAGIHQLALLMLLSERLSVPFEQCLVFDPCHTDRDRSVLDHLGFSVLSCDAPAFVQVPCMTLFYMPHGDYNLTDELVWANRHALHRIAVLGNDFGWVVDPHSSRAEGAADAGTRAPCTQCVLPFIETTELPDTLNRKKKSRLASLVPQASSMIVDRLVDSLDCALTTFPPTEAWEDINWPPEPPVHQSAL